jgi:glycosyltransferase involved in cell wall biosynthesis
VPACIREDWIEEGRPGEASEPIIVWLGKFRRYKCPDHAIVAMKEVVRDVPTARLILAGRHDDLKYEARLQAMARELGIAENVEFRFNISERAKRELLKCARMLVLPSSVEGFGIVVLEANASGVPVVASSGVPASAVRHDYNGLRYEFKDISDLAANIVAILRDNELYQRLSASSLRFADGHAWREVSSGYEDVIRSTARSTHKPEDAKPNHRARRDAS